jgi:hypothetical protein
LKHRTSSLKNERNKIRGALSLIAAADIPSAKTEGWRKQKQAQKQIVDALASAKSKCGHTQFLEFEQWVADLIGRRRQDGRKLGTSLTLLGIFPSDVAKIGLAEELKLSLENVLPEIENLTVFVSDLLEFRQHFDCEAWGSAEGVLDRIRQRDGYSYWLVEAELALRQFAYGTEAVKSHVKSVSIAAPGLSNFIYYFLGVRNEPSQTAERFKSNIRRRLDDSVLSGSLKAYAKYRIYGELDLSSANLEAVLAFDHQTSTLDQFFSLLRVSRFLLANRHAYSDECTAAAIAVSDRLAPITSKLFAANPADNVHGTFLEKVAEDSLQLSITPCDTWPSCSSTYERFVQGVAGGLSTRTAGLREQELSKFLLNFWWMPEALELGETAAIETLPALLCALETSEFDNELNAYSISQAVRLVIRNLIRTTGSDVDGGLAVVLKAVGHYRAGNTDDALDVLSGYPRDNCCNELLDVIETLLARIYFDVGETGMCIKTCAELGISNPNLGSTLPLAELFQGVRWSSLKEYAQEIELPIALDHYLRIVNDRKTRTYKRYAIEEKMNLCNCDSVAKLLEPIYSEDKAEDTFAYFFYVVCDQLTLELLPGVDGSKGALQARLEVLKGLATSCKKGKHSYRSEATLLEHSLDVDDGLSVLDDSKVYVDEKMILESVNREMQSDFARYLKLVESGQGVSDSFPDVIKNLNSSTLDFHIPKNDADDLLGEIVNSMLGQFLFDPAAGLDIIIGRRIRHGTIASEIRGQLESMGLIGQKAHIGAEYGHPEEISKIISTLDSKKAKLVSRAFCRFYEGIDQLIALLRDEYFHVLSSEKPRGIFEVQISVGILILARSIAQTCSSIDEFSKECLGLFWLPLSLRADITRENIEVEIKKTLNELFARLVNELRAQRVTHTGLFMLLQQGAEELERRAAVIASWIRVPKTKIENTSYTMQRVVDIAVAMVTGQRPGFSPDIHSDLPDNLELDTHGLSIVVDALYIALDNVSQHSGKKTKNNVEVSVRFDESTKIISFSITNEIAPGIISQSKKEHVATTLAAIHSKSYRERARRDKGSGLSKLAAIVLQDENTNITFDFIGSDKFLLEFDLRYVSFSNEEGSSSTAVDDPLLPHIGHKPSEAQ